MGQRKSAKRVVPKKNSKKSSHTLRNVLIGIAISLLLLVAGFFGYKYIHYHSAPDAIKQIRQEPIYSYESDNLKIVRRSEDYGGKDWKGVYGNPQVYLDYKAVDYDTCKTELTTVLKDDGWLRARSIDRGGGRLKGVLFTKDIDNHSTSLSLLPSEIKGYTCYVRVDF